MRSSGPADPRRPVAVAAALGSLLALPALGACADGGSPEPSDLDVAVEDGAVVGVVDFAFQPAGVEVAVGEAVRFDQGGEATHTVTAEVFDAGEQEPGDTFRYLATAEDAGEVIEYRCTIHPAMRGRITVRP